MRNQAERNGETEEARAEAGTVKATVRQKPVEKDRNKQRLSSHNPKLKRTKESVNSGGKKAEAEQALGLESGKPTRREAARRNGKGRVGGSSCRD